MTIRSWRRSEKAPSNQGNDQTLGRLSPLIYAQRNSGLFVISLCVVRRPYETCDISLNALDTLPSSGYPMYVGNVYHYHGQRWLNVSVSCSGYIWQQMLRGSETINDWGCPLHKERIITLAYICTEMHFSHNNLNKNIPTKTSLVLHECEQHRVSGTACSCRQVKANIVSVFLSLKSHWS